MIRSLSARTTDRDLGAAALRKMLAEAGNPYALIGIRQDAGVYDQRGRESGDPINLGELAAVHEFGRLDGSIPSRPAVRSTWDANVDGFGRHLARELGDALDGKRTAAQALDRVALRVEAKLAQGMIDLSDPPNAPSTIRGKGSSNPLVDTGQLVASVDSATFKGDGTPARPWAKGGGA